MALLAIVFSGARTFAQETGPGERAAAQSYASLFSPEFRVEGNVVGGIIDDPERRADNENANRISVAEAGIAMRSYVDPFFQFDLEISGGEGFAGETRTQEFGIGQAYATYLRDANGLWARIGKQPSSFGEFNDEDPDEAAVVTAPDAILNYFGEDDGYIDTGIEVNWNVPILDTSHIFWLGLLNGDNAVAFHDGAERKPVYFARYEVFFDAGELTGMEIGLSYLQGLNRRDAAFEDESYKVRGVTRMANIHFELSHQDPVRYLYSGFEITGELFWQNRAYERNAGLDARASEAGLDPAAFDLEETTLGWYLLADFKLGRNWGLSGRLQQAPVLLVEFEEDEGGGGDEEDDGGDAGPYTIYGDDTIDGVSLILSYSPSRFSTIRAEYSRKQIGEESWNEVWLQLLVLIGFERPDVF
jgi:hypothetical protein